MHLMWFPIKNYFTNYELIIETKKQTNKPSRLSRSSIGCILASTQGPNPEFTG